MSANFAKIFEISSDVPIISDNDPPPKKKPLGLTLKITAKSLQVYTGVPSVLRRSFAIDSTYGELSLEGLHEYLIGIKTRYLREKTIILEPKIDLEYEQLVKIMDAVRMLKKTDRALYRKGKRGEDERVKELFDNIVFGDTQS